MLTRASTGGPTGLASGGAKSSDILTLRPLHAHLREQLFHNGAFAFVMFQLFRLSGKETALLRDPAGQRHGAFSRAR